MMSPSVALSAQPSSEMTYATSMPSKSDAVGVAAEASKSVMVPTCPVALRPAITLAV